MDILNIFISKYLLKKVIIFKELLANTGNTVSLFLQCPVANRSMKFQKGF